MNFFFKKSLGQNFLNNEKIKKLIIDTGNINQNNIVLEVGPGNGALTEKILEKNPKNLTVIEKDKNLVSILYKKFGDKITIINDDMLNISYEKYSNENQIIFGNLPYNISTQILTKWIKMKNLDKFCSKFILMFQKEVADRIIAKSNTKEYGRLSIISNWRLNISKITEIDAKNFTPTPKVKSTLLELVPKQKTYNFKNLKNLEHVTNVFFGQRRKMIKKPLSILFNDIDQVSEKLSLDLNMRPQNIDTITYFKICELYETLIN